MCKGCQYKEQKGKTKLNRKEEEIYKGSFLEIDEIIKLLKEIDYIEYMGSGKHRIGNDCSRYYY
jgi:hypothetical protein